MDGIGWDWENDDEFIALLRGLNASRVKAHLEEDRKQAIQLSRRMKRVVATLSDLLESKPSDTWRNATARDVLVPTLENVSDAVTRLRSACETYHQRADKLSSYGVVANEEISRREVNWTEFVQYLFSKCGSYAAASRFISGTAGVASALPQKASTSPSALRLALKRASGRKSPSGREGPAGRQAVNMRKKKKSR